MPADGAGLPASLWPPFTLNNTLYVQRNLGGLCKIFCTCSVFVLPLRCTYAEGVKDHMTVTEAARELGIHPTTLQRRLDSGVMRGERVHPRLWLIPRDEVDRWRDKGRLPAGRPRKQKAED